jgi:peroxiredoxin
LQARQNEFKAAAAEVVAISSSSVEDHASLARKIGAAFPILSDPDGTAIKDYGLLHSGALPFTDSPIARPAVFLLDAAGSIRERYLTDNWRVRQRAELLLERLRGF